MSNYYELILDAINEAGKSIKDLEKSGILGKNTFYIFKNSAPSLNTMLEIANFLNMNVDYILNRDDYNNFKKYSLPQTKFYLNLKTMLGENLSQVKVCKDLGISRTNFSRWKNGTNPTMSKLISLANYLNCNIDDLLSHE